MKERASLFTKVDTVIVRVRDLARALEWYEEKLGLEASHVDDLERLAVFRLGAETSLTIWELKLRDKLAPREFSGSYPIFYVDDIGAVRRALSARGVEVELLKGDLGSIQWFMFRDLDGNLLEVRHY